MNSIKINQFPLKYKETQLHPPDIKSLEPKQWLTAEAIFFGLQYVIPDPTPINLKILDPSLTTLILFENDIEDLLPLSGVLSGKEYLLTAINDSQGGNGSHWGTLVFHNFEFFLFDSGSSQQLYENANDIAKKMTSIIDTGESIPIKNIFVKKFKEIQHQNNSYDCGVYTIAIIQQLVKVISQGEEWNLENITPEYVANLRVTLRAAIKQLYDQ